MCQGVASVPLFTTTWFRLDTHYPWETQDGRVNSHNNRQQLFFLASRWLFFLPVVQQGGQKQNKTLEKVRKKFLKKLPLHYLQSVIAAKSAAVHGRLCTSFVYVLVFFFRNSFLYLLCLNRQRLVGYGKLEKGNKKNKRRLYKYKRKLLTHGGVEKKFRRDTFKSI